MEGSPLPPPPPPLSPGERTVAESDAKSRRVSHACLSCRRRKTRCMLDYECGTVKLPCQRCRKENLECVLGGSNRGGRRIRRRTLPESTGSTDNNAPMGTPATSSPVGQSLNFGGLDTGNIRQPHDPAAHAGGATSMEFDNLQNPSDALGILARVAEEGTPAGRSNLARWKAVNASNDPAARTISCLLPPLLSVGPPETFEISRLHETAEKEPHLLTAILVIASKDLVEETHMYEACSAYMKSLISDLAAGGPGDVEAVEALLLLSEWTPYTQREHSGKVGKGEEDREAWNSSGLALRLAYFLGLEQYSFKVTDDGDPQFSRKLLVWTACYIADRQISIRIGKGFWARGPGPLTALRREHYLSLLPRNPNDEDYASIFQATLELTSLFGNVHDTLYSDVKTLRSHLSGSYIKFIDDFRAASYSWRAVWGTLTCSPNLKAMIEMSYNYLRLYINAFAFHATIRRIQNALAEERNSTSSPIVPQSPSRVFYNNVGAVGDARFIYESMDAAKAILTTVNNFVSPETALRFMPLRFYLYLVYSGVFLFRARIVGVIAAEEERGIRRMIDETIDRLQRSSVGTHHLGTRYSRLLKLLWQKADNHKPPGRSRSTQINRHDRFGEGPTAGAGVSHVTPGAESGSGTVGESPMNNTEQVGDFNWTDLSTIGEFAMSQGQLADDALSWGGFLPLEVGSNLWDVGQFDGGMNF